MLWLRLLSGALMKLMGMIMAELRLAGRPASPGFAEGALFRLVERTVSRIASSDPSREADDLRRAISEAARAIGALADTAEGEAAEILAFQVAMLEDDALSEGAFVAIEQGAAADLAWRQALDGEIESYRAADDEYFRARSADLEDIRDTVLDHLSGEGSALSVPPGSVLVARDLPPSRFLGIDWSQGGAILLSEGSPTSHVAMLARARGVPMIIGMGRLPAHDATAVIVDGASGEAFVEPSATTREAFRKRQQADQEKSGRAAVVATKPAITADGTPITMLINIAGLDDLKGLDPALCDGIGLVRTEFLFGEGPDLPNEDTQYHVYRQMIEWAKGRPVTIRTLDAGGDKPIRGLTIDGESNPFLGVRGIRLSLARPEIFRVQLRALLRAAVHGPLKIMLPMITVPSELEAVRMMVGNAFHALKKEGVDASVPALGIMIEVPAAALAVSHFDADFFSIGSNDLVQYTTAAGRDIGAVSALADPRHPAVLRLIELVASYGAETGREVSLCGDAGGDPELIPDLLRAGLRTLSAAPGLIGRAKLAISEIHLKPSGGF